MIDEKTNLDKGLSTNKTYVRVKNDDSENIEDEIRYMESSTEKDPVLPDDDFAWE